MKLYRTTDDKWVAGVCGGLAANLGWRSGRLRLVWVLATIFSAAFPGIILYLALWFLMPKAALPAEREFEPAVLQPWKKTR